MTDSNDSIERSVSSITSSWLEQARSGNETAWRRLEHAYRRLVFWWCSKSGVRSQDIEDVAQEVFGGVAKSLPTFEHKNFRGFLWTITRNKVQDYWRQHDDEPAGKGGSSIQQVLADVEAESSQSVGHVDRATKLIFDAVVQMVKGEFSDEDWRSFWAVAVEGQSPADVANAQGVSRNKVYLAKSRILRRIREEFGDDLIQG